MKSVGVLRGPGTRASRASAPTNLRWHGSQLVTPNTHAGVSWLTNHRARVHHTSTTQVKLPTPSKGARERRRAELPTRFIPRLSPCLSSHACAPARLHTCATARHPRCLRPPTSPLAAPTTTMAADEHAGHVPISVPMSMPTSVPTSVPIGVPASVHHRPSRNQV